MRIILLVISIVLISGCGIKTFKLYPSLNGKVLNSGEPVSNAEIMFMASYFYGTYITQFDITDKDGSFTIPETSKFTLYGPHPHISHQKLLIKVGNKSYIGLDGNRDYIKDFTENQTILLICDITNSQNNHTIKELNGNWYYHDGFNDRSTYDDTIYQYNGICTATEQ